MKKATLLFIPLLMLVITACSGPQTPVKELKKLAEEVEMNYDNYTDEELENVVVRLEAIDNDMQQYEYTDEELREIGRLNGRLTMYLAKAYMKRVGSAFDDMTEGIMGGMEGFFEALSGSGDDGCTDEQLRENGRLKGKQLGERLRNTAIMFGSGVEGFAEEFEKEMEILADEFENEVESLTEGIE